MARPRSPIDDPVARELPRAERLLRILDFDGAECVWCRRALAPGPAPGIEDTGGRGLMIVDAVANRWGYERRPGGGKHVWFEVDR